MTTWQPAPEPNCRHLLLKDLRVKNSTLLMFSRIARIITVVSNFRMKWARTTLISTFWSKESNIYIVEKTVLQRLSTTVTCSTISFPGFLENYVIGSRNGREARNTKERACNLQMYTKDNKISLTDMSITQIPMIIGAYLIPGDQIVKYMRFFLKR